MASRFISWCGALPFSCALVLVPVVVPGVVKGAGMAGVSAATVSAHSPRVTRLRPEAKPAAAKGAVRHGRPAVSGAKKKKQKRRIVRAPQCQQTGDLCLSSHAVLVVDEQSGQVIFAKNPQQRMSIASITKVMSAMVVLDGQQDHGDLLTIGKEDVDRRRHSRSKLRIGEKVSRLALLRLALVMSDNRAINALARHYPGGRKAFVAEMNRKAQDLGMTHTHFEDPAGLFNGNVSDPQDLTLLVRAARQYPAITQFTTTAEYSMELRGRLIRVHNTNRLVGDANWDIGISKTGYITAAGSCLVMQMTLRGRSLILVLLDAFRSSYRLQDLQNLRGWLESRMTPVAPTFGPQPDDLPELREQAEPATEG